MTKIPFVPKLGEGELLYSYLLRMAKVNGFDQIVFFADCFGLKKSGQSICYDYKWDIYKLVEAIVNNLCSNEPPVR